MYCSMWLPWQVVSGLGRAIPSPAGQAIPGAIQTDAAINSGQSLLAPSLPLWNPTPLLEGRDPMVLKADLNCILVTPLC